MTMAYQPLPAAEIRNGLTFFPQEIFDQIYDYVFTAPSGTRNLSDTAQVRRDYNLLHIDKTTRAMFAKSYYSTVFEMLADPHDGTGKILLSWLRILPEAHRVLVQKVIFIFHEVAPCCVAHLSVTSPCDSQGKLWTARGMVLRSLGKRVARKVYIKVGERVERF